MVNNTGLALPGGSTVYGNNVTITNAGTVTIGGNLAAATGTLQVSALGGSDIAVSGTALIGAATSATIAAEDNFTQSGGIVNAPTLAMSAGGDFTQSGGTIAGNQYRCRRRSNDHRERHARREWRRRRDHVQQ